MHMFDKLCQPERLDLRVETTTIINSIHNLSYYIKPHEQLLI